MRVNYAIIVGHKCFLSEFYLVEVSDRANTALEDLIFRKDHSVCLRHEITALLKILKEPLTFNEKHRIDILKRLVGIIGRKDKKFVENKNICVLA